MAARRGGRLQRPVTEDARADAAAAADPTGDLLLSSSGAGAGFRV